MNLLYITYVHKKQILLTPNVRTNGPTAPTLTPYLRAKTAAGRFRDTNTTVKFFG